MVPVKIFVESKLISECCSLHFLISSSINYCSLNVHCSHQVQYMNYDDTAETSLVAAFLFYNPLFPFKRPVCVGDGHTGTWDGIKHRNYPTVSAGGHFILSQLHFFYFVLN